MGLASMGCITEIARKKELFIVYRWVCLPEYEVAGFHFPHQVVCRFKLFVPLNLCILLVEHPHRFPKYNKLVHVKDVHAFRK